jgi:hypothetical protein
LTGKRVGRRESKQVRGEIVEGGEGCQQSDTKKTDLQERTGRTEERIWSHLKEQQPRQE